MLRSLTLALFASLAVPVNAQSSDLPASGDLLPGWREADGRHIAGLEIRLQPGWKTYWRSPGEGGIPPSFNWSGSANLASVDVRFPIPKVMDQYGLTAIGYDSDTVFPLIVTAKDASQPVSIRAEIEIGVCDEVCIPMTLRLKGELPVSGANDTAIRASLEHQPRPGGQFACNIEPIADGLRLIASTPEPSMETALAVVETSDVDVWVSPGTMSRSTGNLVTTVEMVPPSAQPFALARNDVRLTLIGDGAAIEMQGCR